MLPLNRTLYLTLMWLLLAMLALLSMGAVKERQDFLTRGLITGLPEPINEGGAQLGINVSLAHHDDVSLNANLAQIQKLGVRYLKHSFYFNESFDWDESDRIITAVSDHGLTLIPLLDGDPANNFAPPENPAIFSNWTRDFATRYATQIDHYIIWDEPNLTSHWGEMPVNPAEYGALLTAASQAIRDADPNAIIIAAPLAPTVETGPDNLADPVFLQQLYDAGSSQAFDVIAGKPYGFDTAPVDRDVDQSRLNFSRIILLREVMERNGEGDKAVWAGNWGWNSLPAGWTGRSSIWGQTTESAQAKQTIDAFERARKEWPWMGIMFLENWEPVGPADDPRWGFSIAGRETAAAIQSYQQSDRGEISYPGFHLAQPVDPSQIFNGGWRFSPEFGADISQSDDSVTFNFWGTDAGLRVRRADFRARLYVNVDSQPANALPEDERGSMLVLTSPGYAEDVIKTEWVARDLKPGKHTLHIVASRGWDQWALYGFSVGYHPPDNFYRWSLLGLGFTAVFCLGLAINQGRKANWAVVTRAFANKYLRLSQKGQLALTAVTALLVSLSGWMTWGQELAGPYRRLGDGGQLLVTATAASIFYVSPSLLIFIPALFALFLLLVFRPAWGVALIAFSIPFYANTPDALALLSKPILNYRFAPSEIFTLVTLAAFVTSRIGRILASIKGNSASKYLQISQMKFHTADYAVLAFVLVASVSLPFTERIDVATNEWRVIIVEPAIFYFLIRLSGLNRREMWVMLDAFVLGGLLVAVYGLWQYSLGQDLITSEGGLMRLRSVYGSPNNMALYLGRIFPFLLGMTLLGTQENGRRRWTYAILLIPISLAILLSFSKGALLLGIPAATLFILWQWQQSRGQRSWPLFIGFASLGIFGILIVQQIPQLAGRFDLRGPTGVFRVNLWQASLNMIADHPLFGVGLDNFLYAYRGRYIFDAAWQEPNLSHPHNILLDFASRLGLFGLLTGSWMFWIVGYTLSRVKRRIPIIWLPVAIGLGGALVDIITHGLVDHSFFLVDLAFSFHLILGTSIWLQKEAMLNQNIIENT